MKRLFSTRSLAMLLVLLMLVGFIGPGFDVLGGFFGTSFAAAAAGAPPSVDGSGNVTFTYQNGYADEVWLAGSMYGTDWNNEKQAMSKNGDMWTITINSLSDGIYEYKFVAKYADNPNNQWHTDPNDFERQKSGNSFFVVGDMPGYIVESDGITFTVDVAKNEDREDYSELWVTGDFLKSSDLNINNWSFGDKNKMDDSGTVFTLKTEILPGRYTYKYSGAAGWEGVDFADSEALVTDNSGGNNVLYVPGVLGISGDASFSGSDTPTYTLTELLADGTETAATGVKWSIDGDPADFEIDENTGVLSTVSETDEDITILAEYNETVYELEVSYTAEEPIPPTEAHAPIVSADKRSVTFTVESAVDLWIAGDLSWTLTKMKKVEDTNLYTYTYRFTQPLADGAYTYKFNKADSWGSNTKMLDPNDCGRRTDSNPDNDPSSFFIVGDVPGYTVNSDNGKVTLSVGDDGTYTNIWVNGDFLGDTDLGIPSWSWASGNDLRKMNKSGGVFSKTFNIAPGVYSYRYFAQTGWGTSFKNPDCFNIMGSDNNSVLIVPGTTIAGPSILKKGFSHKYEAPQFRNPDGTLEADPDVDWSLESPVTGVTMNPDGTLTIGSVEDTDGTVNIVAEYKGQKTVKTIKYADGNVFTLHFYKYDKAYTNWNVWFWDESPTKVEHGGLNFDSYTPDANGWITMTQVLPYDTTKVGFIVRKGDWAEESAPSLYVPISGDTEIWHIIGDDLYHTVNTGTTPPYTGPRLRSAFADTKTKITAVMNYEPEGLKPADFKLYNVTDSTDVTATVSITNKTTITFTTSTEILPNKRYEARYNNGTTTYSRDVVMREILNSYKTTVTDLGLSYSASNSVFKVWSPTATDVQVAIYDTINYTNDFDENGKVKNDKLIAPTSLHAMTRDANGVWSCDLSGDYAGKYYMYKITFPNSTVTYAIDPYVKATSANGWLGAIVDLGSTGTVTPLDNDKAVAKNGGVNSNTDQTIYEVHVRDFTIDPSSGVDPLKRGTYEGFAQKGTTVNGNTMVKTGIDHLVEIGVTTVHLLPVFDIGSINELRNDLRDMDTTHQPSVTMNWGYDPQNYNVPEGSYSSDPKNPTARINELKALVSALHDEGIRVVMDVVYNHTFSMEDGPFQKTVPGYYYRTWDDGVYSNGSSCGNETASERDMVRKYIKDSLLYWQSEFGIDGFRFDLMALHDTQTMYEIVDVLTEVDPDCIIYGEPWNGAKKTPLESNPNFVETTKGTQYGQGFAYFNDDVRETIRGDHSSVSNDSADKLGGFAGNGSNNRGIDGIMNSILGNYGQLARASESITYTSKHDNLILFDMMQRAQGTNINSFHGEKLVNSTNSTTYSSDPWVGLSASGSFTLAGMNTGNSANAVRSSLLAVGMVLTMQGVPFIQAGDEFLRTKRGNGNSYNANDYINAINWEDKIRFAEVNDYMAGLIKLRNEHPAFRMDERAVIDGKVEFLSNTDPHFVAFKLGESAGVDSWKNIYVAYNGSSSSKTVNFGVTGLNVVVNAINAGVDTLETLASSTYTVPPYSMVVAYDIVDIYTPELTSAAVSPATSLVAVGGTKKLGITYLDQRNNSFMVSGATVAWSSANPAIATVANDGTVTGVSNGTATIRANVSAGGKTFNVTATVAVREQSYLIILYNSEDAELSDVWVWGDGLSGNAIPFTSNFGNYKAAVIAVPVGASNVGYIIRKEAGTWGLDDGSNKDVNANQYVTMSQNELYTVLLVEPGVPNDTPLPQAISHSSGNTLTLLYRDLNSVSADTVTAKVGTSIVALTWDTANQYFKGTFTGESGQTYNYQFSVNGGAYVNDKYNSSSSFTAPNSSTGGGSGSGSSGGGSSGGGSSGGGSTTSSSSQTTPSTVVVESKVDTSTGTATAEVKLTDLTSSINKAKASGQDDEVIKIKANSGSSDLNSIVVTLQGNAAASIVNDTNASVAIETPLVSVSLNNKALETIVKDGGAGDLSLKVAVVSTETLAGQISENEMAKIGSRPVYEFTVQKGDTTVSNFKGGKATISIPYTPAANENHNAIVVYYIDSDGKLKTMRGKYDAATRSVILVTSHFSKYAIGYNYVNFSDISNKWYTNDVIFNAARGYVTGVGDNKFNPNAVVTRGQFITMLCRAFDIQPRTGDNFNDAGNTYYTGYLAAAKAMGIVAGSGNNNFAPDNEMSREEMFAMVYNTLKVMNELPKGNGGSITSYSDSASIQTWALEAATYLTSNGIISGNDGKLLPKEKFTRAQMARIFVNLLK